jgi:hypothetical protein
LHLKSSTSPDKTIRAWYLFQVESGLNPNRAEPSSPVANRFEAFVGRHTSRCPVGVCRGIRFVQVSVQAGAGQFYAQSHRS